MWKRGYCVSCLKGELEGDKEGKGRPHNMFKDPAGQSPTMGIEGLALGDSCSGRSSGHLGVVSPSISMLHASPHGI